MDLRDSISTPSYVQTAELMLTQRRQALCDL